MIDASPVSDSEKRLLDFSVKGTNMKASALVSGLIQSSDRVEDLLLTEWETLEPGMRPELVDEIAWLLLAASSLIRQMAKDPSARRQARSGASDD